MNKRKNWEKIINFRSDIQLEKKIKRYLKLYPNLTKSDLIRNAIHDYIDNESTDQNLIIQNLHQLNIRMENLDEIQKIFMDFLIFFIKIWFTHTAEIPQDQKGAAWVNGDRRFEQFCKGYRNESINNLSFLSKLLLEMEKFKS